MAKTKAPLLSLGASNSLADTLTFTRKRGVKSVQRKPIPTYRRTLLQVYQRWDYQDGISYWKTLSDAQKAVWESNARPYHMTGFAYFMRDYLTDLPDLIGRWRLDEPTGATAVDSSRQGNNGTLFGTNSIEGIIDRQRNFDALDDRLAIPDSPLWPEAKEHFTIEFFCYSRAGDRTLFGHGNNNDTDYMHCDATVGGANQTRFWVIAGGVLQLQFRLNAMVPFNTNYHFALVRAGNLAADWHVYVDAIDRAKTFMDGSYNCTIPDYTEEFLFGARKSAGAFWEHHDGHFDHIAMYNRALNQADITRHAERQYP